MSVCSRVTPTFFPSVTKGGEGTVGIKFLATEMIKILPSFQFYEFVVVDVAASHMKIAMT